MGFLAAIPAAVGATSGSSLFFTALSAVGQLLTSFTQANIQEQNAARLDQQASDERALAAEEAKLADEKRRKVIGSQTAKLAASGVQVNTGGPLDILEESFFNLTRDIDNIKLQGEVNARNLQTSADIKRSEASLTKTAGFIGAGTSLLGPLFSKKKPTEPDIDRPFTAF